LAEEGAAGETPAPAKAAERRGGKAKPSRLSGLIGQLRRKFGLASAKAV
jgi:hypothetical protein